MTNNPYDKPVIPSQAPARGVPFAPLYRPDKQIQKNPAKPSPSGYPALGSYVVSTFGTLPPNAIDFYQEFGGISSSAPGLVRGQFQLPPGGRLLLRYMVISIVMEWQPEGAPLGGLSLYGMPQPFVTAADGIIQFEQESNFPPSYTILVDGTPIKNYGYKPLFGPTRNPRAIPVHYMIEEGSQLGISVTFGETGEGEFAPPTFNVWGAFMGNWLLNRGDELQLAPTNNYPLPVQEGMLNE